MPWKGALLIFFFLCFPPNLVVSFAFNLLFGTQLKHFKTINSTAPLLGNECVFINVQGNVSSAMSQEELHCP